MGQLKFNLTKEQFYTGTLIIVIHQVLIAETDFVIAENGNLYHSLALFIHQKIQRKRQYWQWVSWKKLLEVRKKLLVGTVVEVTRPVGMLENMFGCRWKTELKEILAICSFRISLQDGQVASNQFEMLPWRENCFVTIFGNKLVIAETELVSRWNWKNLAEVGAFGPSGFHCMKQSGDDSVCMHLKIEEDVHLKLMDVLQQFALVRIGFEGRGWTKL